MSLAANVSEKANLIWAIADKLTGVYKPHEYGEVILPLTVIRRFDCLLEDTKDAVLEKAESMKGNPFREKFLCRASKHPFYNTSKFTFKKLMGDPDNIEDNFRDYLNGFSDNVQDIIAKFKFDGHITTMADKGILYIVLQEFTNEKANLHPDKISNIEMGYIFEEIIRRFSEAHNEDAGQHYTPREVIRLMVNILFNDDNEVLAGNNVVRTIYDPACGTGGMLSVAEEYLHSLNSSTEILASGQEINDQTFAICKADMLIKGNDADNIKDGNTLSADQFGGKHFDYIISNPPFGREWKNEKKVVEAEAKTGFAGRFGPGLPAVGDGQMLFLMTAISKMKEPSEGGSRICIIHNGSPLFTGDAGSGPSNIRKYILENDLLEAIIALPNDIFYNTGIATYIWVLSNKKAGTKREGKVQLINANGLFEKRRKSLGNKRNDIPESAIEEITMLYGDFKESEISKIFNNEEFGYTKITVERPLRQKVEVNEKTINELIKLCQHYNVEFLGEFSKYNKVDDTPVMTLEEVLTSNDYSIREFKTPKSWGQAQADKGLTAALAILMQMKKDTPYMSFNSFEKEFNNNKLAKDADLKWAYLEDTFGWLFVSKDPDADIVYKSNKPVADSSLRDTENVPLTEDIQTYFEREVLPFAPDAWIDEKKNVVGYEIPFTRYFYKYEAPRSAAEIETEILDLALDLQGGLNEVFDL